MPELPEVETIVRDLNTQNLRSRVIRKVHVHWDRTIGAPSAAQFKKSFRSLSIQKIARRAKYIHCILSDKSHLFIHLRMTGRLNFFSSKSKPTKHDHVRFVMNDGVELRFTDTRKFGRIYWLKNPDLIFNKLGPEPLSADWRLDEFKAALKKHKRQIKPLLLDQKFLSGLGNIYVDEALFRAGIRPTRLSSKITRAEAERLFKSIKHVLRIGIKNLGTSLGKAETNYYSVGGRRGRNQDQLQVFRRTGEPCPCCDSPIKRIIVGQRSSHLCLKCQK